MVPFLCEAMNHANRHILNVRAVCQAWVVAALFLQLDCVTAQNFIPVSGGFADRSSSDLQVEISDDLVTLRARNASIQNILDELALRTDLVLVSYDSPEGRLTLELHRLPLSEVLMHILHGRSFLLHQVQAASSDTEGEQHERSSTLWIFSEGSAYGAVNNSSVSTSAIESLEAQLMSGDVSVRREAVKNARKLNGDEASAPLSLALADEDAMVRVKAIYGLADIGGDQAVGALAAALADENAGVREEAAYALGVIGSDAAVQFLEHALHDADSDVRESAIEAFTEIGGGQSARVLAIALQDTDVSLRVEAVEALADIGGETAIGLLDQALEDQDNAVRKAANEALTELLSHDL